MGSGAVSSHAGTAGTSTIGRAAERLAVIRRVFLLDAWIHELELVGSSPRAVEQFQHERDRLVRVHRLDDEEPRS